MKNFILFFLLAPFLTHAQILVLDNSPQRAPEHYGTWTDVYNAASAGDTIYVIGSHISYNNSTITISKPLTVIGTGYNLENAHDSLTVNDFESFLGTVRLDTLADGTTLIGLALGGIIISADDITIRRCEGGITFSTSNSQGADDYDINNCLIVENSLGQVSIDHRVFNTIIANNILASIINNAGVNQEPLIIDHNTFRATTNNNKGLNGVRNSSVSSNIFSIGLTTDYSSNQYGNSFSYNITTDSRLPTSINNLTGQSCTAIVQNCNLNFQNDNNMRLIPGSIAIGAGEGGSDAGCTGGPSPYIFSGFPAIPRLTDLFVQGISTNNMIQVRVKADAQN